MHVNVAQLMQEPSGSFRWHDIVGELPSAVGDESDAVHVEGQVLLTRTIRGVLATGKVRMHLSGMCRRCLETAEIVVSVSLEEEFIPSIDIETGASLPIIGTDDVDLVIDEHHVLDLASPLRQYAVVAETGGALCRPDCKGLCPTCGQNRNLYSCDCDAGSIDPRLASLGDLLGRLESVDEA